MSAEQAQFDVDSLSRLARIHLEPEEKERLRAQLGDILEQFSRLRGCDVSGVEPTAHGNPVHNVWREDRPGPVLPAGTVEAIAPRSSEGQVAVPKVVEDA